MKSITLVLSICLAATAGVWLCGCRPQTDTAPYLGVWGPSSYWYAAEAGRPSLPGIDQGSIAGAIWTRGDGSRGPVFAVWVGAGGGGNTRLRNVPSRTRSATRRDYDLWWELAGVPVEFHTNDGQNGPVMIGSEQYDLAKGALFLVAKRDGKLAVKQLPLAKLNHKPDGTADNERLRELAKSDPEIHAFWTAEGEPK